MRLVIATTLDDPLAGTFWEAYAAAGGAAPQAVFFIAPRRTTTFIRQALEALLLFGPVDAWRSWRGGRRLRGVLLTAPRRLFPDAAIFHVSTLNRGDGLAALQRAAPTLLVSAGAPEIFSRSVLRMPTVGAVNVHNGRLPAYRGLFGTFWEMRRGERWGYASLHTMAPKVDAGPVLAEAAVPMEGRRIRPILLAKKREGARLLAWLVRFVEREGVLPPPRPDDEPRSGYYGWPSWRDLFAFRLAGRRSEKRADNVAAVPSWPPGVLSD
ncbi:MAG TPA: formyltransferase family protein [Dehalococcoidia bacterium]|nr:formyltransferase family protein [Dehalococcoidia bacterium]